MIDAEEPSIAADRHVGVGCLLVELAIAPLALHELLLDPQPLELDGGPRGEDPEDEEPAGLGRHGPLIEDRQVAEHPALAVEQRHAQVALDPQVDEQPVAREPLPDLLGMVAQPPAHDVLAGSPGQLEFEVLLDPAPAPVGERADSRRRPGELGDEGITDAEGRGQVPDQRLEEHRAGAPGRPLEDRPQRGDLIAVQIGAAGRLRLRDGLVPGHGRLALGTSPAMGSRLTRSRRPSP